VRVGERAIHDWRYEGATHAAIVTVPDALKKWALSLSF